VLTVPLSNITGSWRGGLATWGALALVAALPWLGLLRHDIRPRDSDAARIAFRTVARSRLAWWMAFFFGLQSLHAYAIFGWMPEIFRAAGMSPSTSGVLLGATTAIGIPIAFILPSMAVRQRSQTPVVLALCACYVVGYLGLAMRPVAGPWLWAVLIGTGTGLFPLILTLIGLRCRTSEGTAALSGFVQSVGYLMGAVGPFMMGAVYDATGSWREPILVLTVLVLPLAVTGVRASLPRYLEDELR
jgi:CP family cyanate transporter-like MFS transporter